MVDRYIPAIGAVKSDDGAWVKCADYEALEAEVVRLKKVRRNHDRLITELKDKLACILEASDED